MSGPTVKVPVLIESMPECSFIIGDDGQLACANHEYSENWEIAFALGAQPPCTDLVLRWPEPPFPPELFDGASVAGEHIRRLVRGLGNSSTPRLLATMSTHWSFRVRQATAKHFRTDPRVLAKLSRDPHLTVRRAAAASAALDSAVARQLVNTAEETVLLDLARNPQCPPDVLESLVASSLPKVAKEAAYRKSRSAASGHQFGIPRGRGNLR